MFVKEDPPFLTVNANKLDKKNGCSFTESTPPSFSPVKE